MYKVHLHIGKAADEGGQRFHVVHNHPVYTGDTQEDMVRWFDKTLKQVDQPREYIITWHDGPDDAETSRVAALVRFDGRGKAHTTGKVMIKI